MSSIPLTTDGDYSTRLLVEPTRTLYPFLNWPTKDTTTKLFDRLYEIDRASYAPFAALATLPAEGTADPADSLAYILQESEPEYSPDGIARFRCLFGHIPPQKTIQTSIQLTRPDVEGTYTATTCVVYGGFRVFKPDLSLLRYDIYTAQTVTSDGGAPGFYPTGGTYTISFGGFTTGALNYNDAAVTVQAALNALTSVSNRGNVVVTGSYNSAGGIVITFNSYAQITIATGSLTGGTINKTETLAEGGYSQSISAYIIRSIVAVAPTTTSLTKSDPGAFNTYNTDYYNSGGVKIGRQFAIEVASGYVITGGTYTLTVSGFTTAAIAYNATGSTIADALTALGLGNFSVQSSGSNLDPGLTPTGNAITGLVIFDPSGPTGGTFTITVGAYTTGAIAYNASDSTVSSALNGLTSVTNRGGCAVAGSLHAGFAITFANAAITATSSSLTPSGSLATPSITDSSIGRTQKIVYTNPTSFRDLYVAAHGIATGEALYVKLASGATYYFGITNYSVPDANTIRLNLSASDAYAAASTFSECGKRTKRAYTPGMRSVAADKVTDFYLPGAPGQPATDNDITIPSSQASGPDFLEAVFTGQGTINYEVGILDPWRNTPILALTKVVIAVADI